MNCPSDSSRDSCPQALLFPSPNYHCLLFFLQKVPPDLAICNFILEQSLSVRALQEMLANTVEMTEVGVGKGCREKDGNGAKVLGFSQNSCE